MDFSKGVTRSLLLCLLATAVINSCSGNKERKAIVFYIEPIGFEDSLNTIISKGIIGKAAFYKDNKLQIISQNFLTEEYPGMHYLDGLPAGERGIEEGSRKIRAEVTGVPSHNLVLYSLQKYVYKSGKWVKISDMGVMKATSNEKTVYFRDLGKQIINMIVTYTFE